MKKVIFLLAVTLSVAANVSAQGEQFAPKASAQAGHSVSIDLLGVHYGYELPVARTATVVGRAGLNLGVAWSTLREGGSGSGGEWRTGVAIPYGDYFMAAPTVELEPRWYYGLDRREAHGRYTDGNAGSFLSLRVANTFRGWATNDYRVAGSTTFSPTWGLRRVWGGHWMMEFTTGVRFGFVHEDRWWDDDRRMFDGAAEHIDVNVRFGYSF